MHGTWLPTYVRKRFDPAERYGLRVTLFALALVLVAVPFGLLTDQVVRNGPLLEVDKGVAEAIHGWVVRQPDWFVWVVKRISDIGKPPVLTVFAGIGALYVLRHDRIRLALFIVTTSIVGGLVDTAVKILVNRPRPEFEDKIAHALGKSFPSGHAMSSTVVYGALLLAFLPVVPRRRRRWVIGAYVLLVLSIAATRLALGVHFLSDVVGGIVLGVAWLAASVAAFRVWRDERGRRPAPVLAGVEPEAAADLKAPASS
ncbi:MAG TPA: phosphatase PAP2 family protein [Frankiaceae bacterium]|nr:phosphatase PAP2 family protein [Frankiaceae bacterium]